MSSLPPGSWIHSARNYHMNDTILHAELRNRRGRWVKKEIFVEAGRLYDNNDGNFHSHMISDFSDEKNNTMILLMTCTKPYLKSHEEAERRTLYTSVIEQWLTKTNLPIVVVDSSGEQFLKLKEDHPRLKTYSFELNEHKIKKHSLDPKSSSSLEAFSFLKALKKLNSDPDFERITHIMKVTGRYYLENIEDKLNNTIRGADVYTQVHKSHMHHWQNTEYFILKKEYFEAFARKGLEVKECLETNFYNFIKENNLREVTFGPFPNNTRRGGDKIIVNPL